MNINLISKTLKRIEKDYTHFNMSWFWARVTKKMKSKWDRTKKYPNSLSCGTVGCFAGHVVIEVLGPTALKKISGIEQTAAVAQSLLGIADADRAALFYINSTYSGISDYRPGTKAYAQFVTAKIRKYFKRVYGVTV